MVLWFLRPLAPSSLPPNVLSCIPGSRSWGSPPFPASLKGVGGGFTDLQEHGVESLLVFETRPGTSRPTPRPQRCPSGGHPTGAPLQPAQRPLRPELADWDLPGQVEPRGEERGGREGSPASRSGCWLARAGRAEGRARIRFRGRHREVPLKSERGLQSPP